MKRLVGVPLPPLPVGLGPTLLPRPQRLYFAFGTPIDTTRFAGDDGSENARQLRDQVRQAVLDGIAELQRFRDADPDRHLLRRLRGVHEPLPQLAASDPEAYFATKAFEAWSTHGPAGAAAWLSRWVELVDPPDWPGARTWRGRDAAVRRLEQVAAQLGGAHVTVVGARSRAADEVEVRFEVRESRASSAPVVGRFNVLLTLEQDQITRAEVRTQAS